MEATTEQLTDAELKLKEIREAEMEAAELNLDWLELKKRAGDAKERYDDAVIRLRSIIRKSSEPTLFDAKPEVSEVVQEVRTEALVTSFDVPTTGFSEADIKPYGVVLPEPPPGVADWTAISLRVAGISDRRSEILEAADIFNLGQLYERNSNGATILDIDRVTPKFGEAIAATIGKFFEKLSRKKSGHETVQPQEETAEEETED